VEEFTARFGPSQEDYAAVIHFAEANGLTVVGTSRNRMNLDVSGPVANIEAAFHLTMGVYQHPTENRTFFAPDREPTPDLRSSYGASQASTTIRPQNPLSCVAMRARRCPLSCVAMRVF